MNTVGWQKLEGGIIALAGLVIALLVSPGWAWWVWILLLLAPDLSMAGYLAGSRIGAQAYNLIHLYALPFLLMVLGVAAGAPALIAAGGLWLAHVGADRALGFGLKEAAGFAHTHLGRIGRGG
ncbi:DUF4260 domain-containing protein [uncultured Paracoccus sp.]|uniref:DUF4260 domain-containing protein n=1 Tax=uncultured Paracoccus sp. TaxID=189685 RepID=UPI0025D5AFCD|nr:DUF4260 domain-containing protein [uncultured Paracoccus sp.]